MKTKILTIMLILTLCLGLFTFFGCDTNKTTGLSKNEWNAMLDKSNFDNCTITMTSKSVLTQLSDGSQIMTNETNTSKIFDNKVYVTVSGTVDGGEFTNEDTLEGEEAESTRTSFVEQFAALKYEYFDYDPETSVYKANRSIEVPQKNIYIEFVDGEEIRTEETVTVLWENVIVEILEEKLHKISFNTIYTNEKFQSRTELECILTLSNYGTTK